MTKNLRVLILLLAPLFSCQKDDDLIVTQPTAQTWVLVRLTGQINNWQWPGAVLNYNQSYVFQADSTFIKRRQQGSQIEETNGTYSVRTDAQGPYLKVIKLTYAVDNPLLINCTSEPVEFLGQMDETTLISSSQACDGPLLEYKKQ